MPVEESQAEKKKRNANNPQVKLDHTIPLQLGGSNSPDKLKIVTNAEHTKYTKVENALGRALKAGKISKKEAQNLIVRYKRGELDGEDLINKYK